MNMFTKSLYKRDLNSNVRIWTIEVEGNRYRTISGILDGAKVTSEWSYAYGKNEGRSNATTDEEQAMRVAETLIRVRKENGCHENIEDIDKGKEYFQPMLASKWDALKSKVQYPVDVQWKLDGIRLICDVDGMHSRHGKEIISAPHIREALNKAFEDNPDLILDGELYCHDLNEDFNKIISLVRKTKPTKEDLVESERTVQYWIYDIPSVAGTNAERDKARIEFFRKYILHADIEKYFVFVPSMIAYNEEQVDHLLEHNIAWGYEGAIIRIPSGEYECKRSKNLMKYKKFLDEEFLIEDFEEGRGNLSGKVGKVVCSTKEGKRFSAGMKFSHDEAKEMWEHKEDYIGKKKCTVKFFQWTPDGLPRFPKCIAIRDYE